MRNKLIVSLIISGIIFCLSYTCFSGEVEINWKEAYYQKSIQCAQYEIIIAQNELNKLEELKKQGEVKKQEIKKEESKNESR